MKDMNATDMILRAKNAPARVRNAMEALGELNPKAKKKKKKGRARKKK